MLYLHSSGPVSFDLTELCNVWKDCSASFSSCCLHVRAFLFYSWVWSCIDWNIWCFLSVRAVHSSNFSNRSLIYIITSTVLSISSRDGVRCASTAGS